MGRAFLFIVLVLALTAKAGQLSALPALRRSGGCYSVTRVAVDKNGKPVPGKEPSIIRQGRPLSEAQVGAAQKAIDMIRLWERRYNISPFRGSSMPSAELLALLNEGAICVEDPDLRSGVAASTWLGPYKIVGNNLLEEGRGGKAIHVSQDYLPKNRQSLVQEDVAVLAAVLLHESGHLQQEWNVNQKNQLELPVYSWVIVQLGAILGDVTLPVDIKEALYKTIVTSAAYCRDAPSIRLALPQPTVLATKHQGPVKEIHVLANGRSFFAMTSSSLSAWDTITLASKWEVGDQGLLSMCCLGGNVLVCNSDDVYLVQEKDGKRKKSANSAMAELYKSVNGLRRIVATSGSVWFLDRDELRCVGYNADLPDSVFCIAFNADQRAVVVAEERGTISFWHVGTRKRLPKMDIDIDVQERVTCVESSGDSVFVGYANGRVDYWLREKGASGEVTVMHLYGHESAVSGISLHAKRKWLATCDANGVVAIWSLDTGSLLLQVAEGGTAVQFILSAGNDALVVGGNGSVAVYNLELAEMLSAQGETRSR